jgi:hypothetical protein
LDELHRVEKSLEDCTAWSANSAGTIDEAYGTVRVNDPTSLSFRVQSVMELVLKVVLPNRPKRLDLFYRVRASGQIVRMYHSDPGHDDIDGRIPDPHKHYFPQPHFKRAYAVTDIPRPVNQAVRAFLVEEHIQMACPLPAFTAVARMEREW